MKSIGLLCVFALLALAVAPTGVRADDACALCATSTSSCDCDPGIGKACDCCGPGTNPWDGTLKAGAGLRFSDNYMKEENGPTSNTYNFFNPTDMRIYLNGTAFHGIIKGTLDTEVAGGGTFVSPNDVTTVNLLDGIAQFEFNDKLNFWAGRFLPPTDRANLDGPFYQTPYDYPFASNYPSLLAGRDDGAAYWGQAGGGKLKWQVGMFNGIPTGTGIGRQYDAVGNALGPNATGDYFFIGRVTVNLLDPEPGYYTQSCYFGDKEILAIGITGAYQRDASGTAANPADFSAGSIDFLWEHRFGNCGVIDIEGAYYKYDYGVLASTAGAATAFGTANQGTSQYFQVSYLLPHDICFCGVSGRLQPFARYQYYDRDFKAQAAALSTVASPLFYEGVDIGVNYVISGYNARTTLAWEQRDAEGGLTYELLRIGVQLQF